MSRTVRINPLLVLISILVAASIGSWIGGFFGGFVAALLAIPAAGAGQVIMSELWRDTAPGGVLAGAGPAGTGSGPADAGVPEDAGGPEAGPGGTEPTVAGSVSGGKPGG